jgi:hypothetical protein
MTKLRFRGVSIAAEEAEGSGKAGFKALHLPAEL